MNNNLYKITVAVVVTFLLVFTGVGVTSLFDNNNYVSDIESFKSSKKPLGDIIYFNEYTHTVFLGVGTSQICKPCHEWNEIIQEAYISGLYDFEYVEMIEFDHQGKILNKKANEWSKYYEIESFPTSIFDGDFTRVVGNYSEELSDAFDSSGNREVADIASNITLSWLGDAKIQVNITIKNNEDTQYNGYVRAFISEITSRYDTYYGDPYHFGFLDYALDENISIDAGEEYFDSIIWNGNEHEDEHGDDFGDITANNIQVTLVVYNDYNGYVDETVSARIQANSPPFIPYDPVPSDEEKDVVVGIDLSWKGGDPDGDFVKYDVYFGNNNPPPKKSENQSILEYDPGIIQYETTYYWKVVAWDEHGLKAEGAVWKFTTTQQKNLEVEIYTPTEESFYLRNFRLFSFPFITFVYGPINIKVNATSSAGIKNVEFYINGEIKGNVSEAPYNFRWTPIICSIYKIKAIAYDYNGDQKHDEITVFKWRVHPVIIIGGITLIIILRLRF